MQFTTEPLAWAEWVKTQRTWEQLAIIKMRARTVTKFTARDREALNRDFRAKIKAMG